MYHWCPFVLMKKYEVPILADCLAMPVANMHTRYLISILTVWWLYSVFWSTIYFLLCLIYFHLFFLWTKWLAFSYFYFLCCCSAFVVEKMCRAILSIAAAISALHFSSSLPFQRHHPFHRCFYFCRCCFPIGCHVRDTRYLILSNLLIFFFIHNNFFLNSLVWPYIFFLVRLCLQATNNSFWCARERWVPHLRPFAACFLNCSTSL